MVVAAAASLQKSDMEKLNTEQSMSIAVSANIFGNTGSPRIVRIQTVWFHYSAVFPNQTLQGSKSSTFSSSLRSTWLEYKWGSFSWSILLRGDGKGKKHRRKKSPLQFVNSQSNSRCTGPLRKLRWWKTVRVRWFGLWLLYVPISLSSWFSTYT